jgi:hypothetical protein
VPHPIRVRWKRLNHLVREYLLGSLDDKKELEEQLSREICVNDDLSEMVESIEEEIIEDFLDGALDPAGKVAVDGYFLRPPERKEKLRFARILRHHLEQRQDLVNTRTETFGSANVRPESIDYRSPHFGTLISETMGSSPHWSCLLSRV